MKKFLSAKRKYLISALVLILGAGAVLFFAKIHGTDSENTQFEKYIDQIFREELEGNTLNLHYTLAYPEDYGIKGYSVSLGTMEPEALEDSLEETRTLNKKLKNFDSDQLSEENQIIYDILSLEFSSRLSLGSSYLLQEPLGPNLGIQAQLPILLAEYTFRTSADIKDYFSLLSQMPEYFQSILDFEEEKAKEGLFMSDVSADRIIRQCRSFMETGEDNYLYSMFRQQIEELSEDKRITQDQAENFTKMQEKLMDQCVFPAYLTLSQGLEELKGQGKNSGGLVHLEGGKDYYEYLIRSTVGDYRSSEEILQDLFLQLQTDYQEVQQLLRPWIICSMLSLTIFLLWKWSLTKSSMCQSLWKNSPARLFISPLLLTPLRPIQFISTRPARYLRRNFSPHWPTRDSPGIYTRRYILENRPIIPYGNF